eukprot:scaffold2141_cov282-Pinguiococcus_pyrenoidosus.AAC.34
MPRHVKDHFRPIVHSRVQAALCLGLLEVFAAVEGDGLGVLPDAHEAEAEVSLRAQLLVVEIDQLLSDLDGDEGPYRSVHDDDDEQLRIDRVENRREAEEVYHSPKHRYQQSKRGTRKGGHILCNALIRIVQRDGVSSG